MDEMSERGNEKNIYITKTIYFDPFPNKMVAHWNWILDCVHHLQHFNSIFTCISGPSARCCIQCKFFHNTIHPKNSCSMRNEWDSFKIIIIIIMRTCSYHINPLHTNWSCQDLTQFSTVVCSAFLYARHRRRKCYRNKFKCASTRFNDLSDKDIHITHSLLTLTWGRSTIHINFAYRM